MKTRVQELLQIGDVLYSRRFPLLTLWQSFAENFYPIRADMTRDHRAISEEFASYLMTGRPVLAHRELANALSAILRPRSMQWFEARTADDAINHDRDCKLWLERAGAAMRRIMYDRASQFTRATRRAMPTTSCSANASSSRGSTSAAPACSIGHGTCAIASGQRMPSLPLTNFIVSGSSMRERW
jgi:hypothetical protein